MPHLARIAIFPIKALDGVVLPEAELLPAGPLRHDRRFAILDEAGKPMNGKRTPRVHLLRPVYGPDLEWVRFALEGGASAGPFPLDGTRRELAAWLGDYFGQPVTVAEDRAAGFPDDTNAPGPTVVGTATLGTIASWFPGLTLEEVRARFRANLEIDGTPAFWEDRLFGDKGQVVPFRIGQAQLEGVNPCQRCVVPTRDSRSAEPTPHFARGFSARRRAGLPAWAAASRFDHFYRLAVNTRPAAGGGSVVRVGDEVRVEAARPA